MNSVSVRKPRAGIKRKMRPGECPGLRTIPRKANEFGFGTQTAGREKRKRRPGGRPGLRTTPRKANEFGFGTQTPGRGKWKMRPGRSNLLLLFSIGKSTGNKIQSHIHVAYMSRMNKCQHVAHARRANAKKGKEKQCEKEHFGESGNRE